MALDFPMPSQARQDLGGNKQAERRCIRHSQHLSYFVAIGSKNNVTISRTHLEQRCLGMCALMNDKNHHDHNPRHLYIHSLLGSLLLPETRQGAVSRCVERSAADEPSSASPETSCPWNSMAIGSTGSMRPDARL